MKKKTFVILLFFFPPIVHLLHFITTRGVEAVFIFGYKNIFLKFIEIIMNNFGFYATCFSLFWAVESFFKQEKERQVEREEKDKELKDSIDRENKKVQDEILRREEEKNEIKLKELEKYKDSFRPNFVLSQDGRKLIVIMKNRDYYLENVKFYKSDDDSGKQYINLRHNMKIDLNGVVNNYYITAETLIGEKIIFGVILNTVKVYKILKDGCSPIIPNDFHGKSLDIEKKINDNWISFNDFRIKNEEGNYKNTDINFMCKTVAIREKMVLNTTEHMKEILLINSVESIFTTVLASISSNKTEFSDTIRETVIRELYEILCENLGKITINPNGIEQHTWKYINSKINIQNSFTGDQSYAAAYIVNQYVAKMNLKNIDDIISIFLELIRHAEFAKELENNLEILKNRIIYMIES